VPLGPEIRHHGESRFEEGGCGGGGTFTAVIGLERPSGREVIHLQLFCCRDAVTLTTRVRCSLPPGNPRDLNACFLAKVFRGGVKVEAFCLGPQVELVSLCLKLETAKAITSQVDAKGSRLGGL